MTNLTPYMCLKVKRDTFFLPDSKGGVYFRNNVCSFHMEGNGIDQWVNKLMPMFNGEHTLGTLTNGLAGPYRDRVYEIAEVLYENGFVRDMSQDIPHQLAKHVLEKYDSQIEFLDHFGASGAHRFQVYRQAKVLAVGCGPFFISLVSALLESGLPKFHVLILDSAPTNRLRLKELTAYAHATDAEVEIVEVNLFKESEGSWQEIVQPFDSVLYVSQEGNIEELQALQKVCKEEKKVFIPAICLEQIGMAGPLVYPESDGCWGSAWHRLHQSALCKEQQLHTFSTTAGAMLANIIVFELFKKIAKVTESEQGEQFFLLDLDTLEGAWHSFKPHPLVTRSASMEWIQDLDIRLKKSTRGSDLSELLLYFNQLTSAKAGIFHIWEEGELTQLPLAQCRVQVVNPLAAGPTDLLPEVICTGLTHEEVRKEAGLSGIEAHVSRTLEELATKLPAYEEIDANIIEVQEFVGIGAGETIVEGICRGLQSCLQEELSKQQGSQRNPVTLVQLDLIEDERCQFYLQALTTLQGVPLIGLGEDVFGFPVVWVGTDEGWYSSVGLNITLALRRVLQQVMMEIQNQVTALTVLPDSSIRLDNSLPKKLVINSCEENVQGKVLQSAMQILERNNKELLVFQLLWEPFLKGELIEVFGVLLREEELQ